MTTPLRLNDAYGRELSLEGLWQGQTLFLCLSGKSLASLDLSKLYQRGVVSMAVNNAASMIRPTFWVTVDNPRSFIDAAWRDPGIMKLLSPKHIGTHLRTRMPDGSFKDLSLLVGQCPNTYFFDRNNRFVADTYLTEQSVNWGNGEGIADSQGNKGKRSVMLAAIRLAYWFGFRTVYLCGADFKMVENSQNYAFPQTRSQGSVRGNNKTYLALVKRFTDLLPEFEKRKFRVFNCNPDSELKVFPFANFDEAVEKVAKDFRNLETEGYYEKALGQPESRAPGQPHRHDGPAGVARPKYAQKGPKNRGRGGPLSPQKLNP